MTTFDQLPADQRAIIELVLQRGQSYDDLSGMLGMPASRVRELAREALADLTPASARRVQDDWRGQVADYVLGQQSGPESTATRGHLRRSEAARTWALSLLDSLDDLYGNGARPEVPEGEAEPRRERGRTAAAPRPPRTPRAERPSRAAGLRPDGPLSPAAAAAVRRRRLVAAALAGAVVLFAVLVFPIGLLTGGDEDEKDGGGETQEAAGGTPQIVGSPIVLRPTEGEEGAGSAVIAEMNGERVLIVQARGLTPSKQPDAQQRGGTAYEVWLYNSRGDAVSVGAQLTDAEGNFQGAGPLPEQFQDYRFIDVSRESIDENARHSGESVLRGRISDLTQAPAAGAPEGGAAPGGGALPEGGGALPEGGGAAPEGGAAPGGTPQP